MKRWCVANGPGHDTGESVQTHSIAEEQSAVEQPPMQVGGGFGGGLSPARNVEVTPLAHPPSRRGAFVTLVRLFFYDARRRRVVVFLEINEAGCRGRVLCGLGFRDAGAGAVAEQPDVMSLRSSPREGERRAIVAAAKVLHADELRFAHPLQRRTRPFGS